MEHTTESNITNANMDYNRTDKICSCGRAMIVRVNKSSGSKFLGCSGYPNCKNTISICERNKIIKTTNKYTPIKLTSYVNKYDNYSNNYNSSYGYNDDDYYWGTGGQIHCKDDM